MPSKQMKCCCVKPCQGQCVNIGSLFTQCTVCQESPLFWDIKDFAAISGTYFTCCPNLTDPPVFGLMMGQVGGASCTWISSVLPCNDGSTAQWILTVSGTAIGDVTLQVRWSDGRILEYANDAVWLCLCANPMARTFIHDVGNVNGCNPKPTLCLIPVPPCCADRTDPLPRTLAAQISIHSGSCPCFPLGTTVGTLTWNASDYKWEGTVTMGTCGNVIIQLGCSRLASYNDITDWNGTVQFGSDAPQDISGNLVTTNCSPLHVHLDYLFTGGICGPLAVYEAYIDIIEF